MSVFTSLVPKQPSAATRQSDQAGIVSLMVTMVLIIVVSLIVLGFAQISRRNAGDTLNRQLSTQAFYAAETGINDARQIINKNPNASGYEKPNCDRTGAATVYSALPNNVIDSAHDVSYTCLLVNTALDSLQYDGITQTGTVIPIKSADGSNFSSIKITWQAKGATNPAANCPSSAAKAFTPNDASWKCGYGVFRFDLVPTSGTFNNYSLETSTMTSFLVPIKPGGSGVNNLGFASGTTNGGNLAGTKCTNSSCVMTINGLDTNQYYMRAMSLYKDSALTITARNGSGPVKLTGAQASIDATGKAEGVLRRIQVHVPLPTLAPNTLPDYALESTDSLCKRFSVMDGYFNNGFALSYSDTNPLCQPVSVSNSPSGGGPNGDAKFTTCGDGCELGGGRKKGDGPSWTRLFQNVSDNPSTQIAGCSWSFGDGQVATNRACLPGETIGHAYDKRDGKCYSVHIVLTMHLKNGLNPRYDYDTYVPHGGGAKSC